MGSYKAHANLGEVFGRDRQDRRSRSEPSRNANDPRTQVDLSKLWDCPLYVDGSLDLRGESSDRYERALDTLDARWDISDDEDVEFHAITRCPKHRTAWLLTLACALACSFAAFLFAGGLLVTTSLVLWWILSCHTLMVVRHVKVKSARAIDAAPVGEWSTECKSNAFEVAQVISLKQLERGIARSRLRAARKNAIKASYEEEVYEAVESGCEAPLTRKLHTRD